MFLLNLLLHVRKIKKIINVNFRPLILRFVHFHSFLDKRVLLRDAGFFQRHQASGVP
jgi:hypothetical protein